MKAASTDEPAGFGPPFLPQDTSGDDSSFVGLNENHLLREDSLAFSDWTWRTRGRNGELRNGFFQEDDAVLTESTRRFTRCFESMI